MLQIQANHYLLHSNNTITGKEVCLNNTNSEYYIPQGVSLAKVSATCRTQLCEYVIISDLSNKSTTYLKHYQWKPEQVTKR
jgi:hypothetical protein